MFDSDPDGETENRNRNRLDLLCCLGVFASWREPECSGVGAILWRRALCPEKQAKGEKPTV
jgi:hypothetical protein